MQSSSTHRENRPPPTGALGAVALFVAPFFAPFFALFVATFVTFGLGACTPDRAPDRETSVPANHTPESFIHVIENIEFDFNVHWPPLAPDNQNYLTQTPLLNGKMFVAIGDDGKRSTDLGLRFELNRSASEEDRTRWNTQLAFPEYEWMSKVRVWDADQQWIWPNLPFLLRAYGSERTERYGGVDPTKKVDNDFAAILIRSVNSSGQPWLSESEMPLVSAEWYAPAGVASTKSTIVHSALSDDFRIELGDGRGEFADGNAGELRIWLIYGDFMDGVVPRRWPVEKEFDGGILSYFVVEWDRERSAGGQMRVRQEIPPASTGFDWNDWQRRGKQKRLKAHVRP